MKKLILLCLMVLSSTLTPFAVSAIPDELSDEYGNVVFSASDPEFDWSQTDTKQIKVKFKSQALQFESKLPNGFAFSVTELPINVEDTPDFLFGFTLNGFKPSDYTKNEKIFSGLLKQSDTNNNLLIPGSFGMLFDYQDVHNYKALAIFKKTYQYYTVKDGIISLVKSGPVKYNGDSFKLILKRENGGIEFVLNEIEVCNLRKIALTSSFFGVFINGKGKAEMPSFMMFIPAQEDIEQTTTNT